MTAQNKRRWYKWHRRLGIIVLIPIILWTVSGTMHPLMANWFRPNLAHQEPATPILSPENIKLSLNELLSLQHITTFSNFRIVLFDTSYYYQIDFGKSGLRYFKADNGEELEHGDELYADQLARFYSGFTDSIQQRYMLTHFDHQYKAINRLLPVYRIRFDKADIYVDTRSDRLGTYNSTARKAFIWLFNNLHNWLFLEGIGNILFRKVIMLTFLSIIWVTAISGLFVYGFMWKKTKKLSKIKDKKPQHKLRKYHRTLGIAISVFMLTFAGSGSFHLLLVDNTQQIDSDTYEHTQQIQQNRLIVDTKVLLRKYGALTNLSVAQVGDQYFYQLYGRNTKENIGTVRYINAHDGEEWKNGDREYAIYLAGIYAQKDGLDAVSLAAEKPRKINTFNAEYGFINKRLPVWRVASNNQNDLRYYIETSTGILSSKVKPLDIIEGYSFAFLHKFHPVGFVLGNNIRDILLVLIALSICAVSILGLIMLIRKK